MADIIQTKEVLKEYFQTGDIPTELQYRNLIESLRHVHDKISLEGLNLEGYDEEGERDNNLYVRLGDFLDASNGTKMIIDDTNTEITFKGKIKSEDDIDAIGRNITAGSFIGDGSQLTNITAVSPSNAAYTDTDNNFISAQTIANSAPVFNLKDVNATNTSDISGYLYYKDSNNTSGAYVGMANDNLELWSRNGNINLKSNAQFDNNLSIANSNNISWRNAANSADIPLLLLNNNNEFFIGTTSSSAPSKIKLHTGQQLRYEIDENGNHDFQSGTATFGGTLHLQNDVNITSIYPRIRFTDSDTTHDNWSLINNNGDFIIHDDTNGAVLTRWINTTNELRHRGFVNIETTTASSDVAKLVLTNRDISVTNEQELSSIEFYNSDADGGHTSAFIKNLAAETYGRKGQLVFGVSRINSTNAEEVARFDENGTFNVNGGIDATGQTITATKFEFDLNGGAITPSIVRNPFSGGLIINTNTAVSSGLDLLSVRSGAVSKFRIQENGNGWFNGAVTASDFLGNWNGKSTSDFVNTSDTQTISGKKTFTNDIDIIYDKINFYTDPIAPGNPGTGFSSVLEGSITGVHGQGLEIDTNLTINGEIHTNQPIEAKSFLGDAYSLNSLNTAPSSSTDTGTQGEIRYTADYIYVCTAADTWKRTTLTTW